MRVTKITICRPLRQRLDIPDENDVSDAAKKTKVKKTQRTEQVVRLKARKRLVYFLDLNKVKKQFW